MLRLLIIGGLLFFAYRLIKTRLFSGRSTGTAVNDRTTGEIDDVMIKDPYCGIYFPEKDGAHLSWKGERLTFCSEDCRDKFTKGRQDTGG